MLIGIFLLVVIGSCGVLLENSFRILFLLFIWFVRIFGIFFDVFILERILFVVLVIMFFVELLYEEICLEILVLVGIVFILVIRVSLFRLLVIDRGLEIFFNILVLFFSVI